MDREGRKGHGADGRRGGQAGNLDRSPYTPLPATPASHALPLTRKTGLCLLPCTPGPHACLLHLHPWDQQWSQREGNIWKAGGLGQSSSWRAGGGDVGGAQGPAGWE